MSGRLRAHLTVMVCGSQYAGVKIPDLALILLSVSRKAILGLHFGLHLCGTSEPCRLVQRDSSAGRAVPTAGALSSGSASSDGRLRSASASPP